MLGIGIHLFIDGFIYSITFTVSIFTGVLAATGMVLHEFPEGIITYLLPQAEKEHARFSLIALGAGIIVAMLIVLSK